MEVVLLQLWNAMQGIPHVRAWLAAGWAALEEHTREVVRRGRAAPSHIVNLGHGVPPETDPTVLTRVVELVHSL